MRYLTFSDDANGRQQVELFWNAVNGNQEGRTRSEQRAIGKLLDKLEALTESVPPEIRCDGCGKTLAKVPVDLVDQRTVPEGSGPRELALEDEEHRLAVACLQPEKLKLAGRQARLNEALLTALEDARAEKPAA